MRDTFGGEFSATTAIAFAIGGIAALFLATALALGGYGRPGRHTPPRNTGAPSPSATSSAQPGAEVEYLLDVAEPAASGR